MTTTISKTQSAQFISGLVDTSTIAYTVSSGADSVAMYRFQLPSANTYLLHEATLDLFIKGTFVGPTETFKVYLLLEGDALPTITSTTLTESQVPEGVWIFGEAEALEVGTTTLSTYDAIEYTAISIDLDLALITRVMSSSLSYSDAFTGSLLFWVAAEQDNSTTTFASSATLTAFDTIEYANRDTGGHGTPGSRIDRCPVTGLKIQRGEMVMDGYRKILVSPEAYDPEEPEALDWGPEDNDETNENI